MTLETYLNPTLQPISDAVVEARQRGAQDPKRFLLFERATELMNPGYHEVENGYCLNEDGSAYVAVLTDMPQVTPAMWHWWFGWHLGTLGKNAVEGLPQAKDLLLNKIFRTHPAFSSRSGLFIKV